MTPEKKAALISALRTVLSTGAAFLFAAFVANPIVAASLDLLSTAIVAYWSFAQKSDTEQSAFSMLMGPLRNIAVALATYAVTRGWISQDQSSQLLTGVFVLATALWGIEQKLVQGRQFAMLLVIGFGAMSALSLYGCGTALGTVGIGTLQSTPIPGQDKTVFGAELTFDFLVREAQHYVDTGLASPSQKAVIHAAVVKAQAVNRATRMTAENGTNAASAALLAGLNAANISFAAALANLGVPFGG